MEMLWGKEHAGAVEDKNYSTKIDINMWVKNANDLLQELLNDYQDETSLQTELELQMCLEEKFSHVRNIFVEDHDDCYVCVTLTFDEARMMINAKNKHKDSPVFTGIRCGLRSLPSGFSLYSWIQHRTWQISHHIMVLTPPCDFS
jgi:hypothetical protein